MKKLFLLCCCALAFSCQETKKEKPKLIEKQPAEEAVIKPSVPTEKLCFLSTIGSSKVQEKAIQDSLILKLEISGKNVSGTFDWVPAEKDARRGTIDGVKVKDTILGEYVFQQEGKRDVLPIRIELQDNIAKVITGAGPPQEMVMEIEKVDCK